MAGESTLRCEPARQLASIRLDGELSDLEAASLDRHLSSCPSCREWAREVGKTSSALREAPLERPSRPLVPAPAPARRRIPWKVVAAAAVVVLTAALGSVLGVALSGGSRPAKQPSVPVLSLLPDGFRAPAGQAPIRRPEPRMPGNPV
jgi:predicted anti-sigma-YlaC factor YlaD